MILAKTIKIAKKETGLAAGTFAVASIMHQKRVWKQIAKYF
jgi:hypothetical protein